MFGYDQIRLWEQGVVGSNLAAPTTRRKSEPRAIRMQLLGLAFAVIVSAGSCLPRAPTQGDPTADDSASACGLLGLMAAGVELEQTQGKVLLQVCMDAVTLANDRRIRLQLRLFAGQRFDQVAVTVRTPNQSLTQVEPRGAIKGSQRPGYAFTDQLLMELGPLRTPIEWLGVAVRVNNLGAPLHADHFAFEVSLPVAWLSTAPER